MTAGKFLARMEEFVLIAFTVIVAGVHLDLKVLIVKQVSAHIIFESLFVLSPLFFVFHVIQYLSLFFYSKSQTNTSFLDTYRSVAFNLFPRTAHFCKFWKSIISHRPLTFDQKSPPSLIHLDPESKYIK